MTISMRALMCTCVFVVLCIVVPTRAALPLELAEVVPMSAEDLLSYPDASFPMLAEQRSRAQQKDEPTTEKPQLGEDILAAVKRLKSHRDEIVKLESAIDAQTATFRRYDPQQKEPQVEGGTSSESNYFQKNIDELKSSQTFRANEAANDLTVSDAKCVVCQYLVQQTQGVCAGAPLQSGGATAGGKRAAALAAVAAADAGAAAFVELESEIERRPAVRAYSGPNLRNFAPLTYPDQLNDHGFEDVSRNRKADVLQYRPRQARFIRPDYNDAVAQWEQTRATYQKLYGAVYNSLETLCAKKMPLAYAAYCQELLKDYRYIAQGIVYGDRAQSICMNANWCDGKSYIRNAVHAYFVRENGDSPV